MKTRLQTIFFIIITTLIVSVLLFTELVTSATAGDQAPETDTLANIKQFTPQNTTGDDITITIVGGELVNAVNTNPSTPPFIVGNPVTLTAVADPAWEFVNWSGSLTGDLSPKTLIFTGDDSVTANFEKRCFTLKLTISGDGDPIAANPEQSSECLSTGQYVAGELISLTANPANHWSVSSWTGATPEDPPDDTASVSMLTSDHEVGVTYAPICFALNLFVKPLLSHGSIEHLPKPDQYCIDQYLEGTEVSLTAKPAPGYTFTYWNEDTADTIDEKTLVMSKIRSVTANFEKACHPLTLTHAPAGSGSNPEAFPEKSDQCQSDLHYVLGEEINLSAFPYPGWQVESWLGTNNNSSTLTFPALSGAEGHIVTVNYIPRPTLQFSAETFTVNEDVIEAKVFVKRTGSLVETVSVKYATSDDIDSAKSGQDYTATNGTLTFELGPDDSSQFFIVRIKNDNNPEGTEHLLLTLSNPTGGALLGAVDEAKLIILDDEGDPTVQFSTTTYEAVESSSSVAITVTLFPASTEHVFIELNTQAGTATNGKDYWDQSQTLRFWPGTTSEQVIVTLLDDILDEPDETVQLQLSDISGAELGESEAVLTLIDDEDPPTVQFSESQYYAKEGEPKAPITFTLSAASALSVTLDYEVIELTVGRQFADTITFDPGEESKSVDIPIASYQVGDELNIVLNTAENATLAPPASAVLTILDRNLSECHLLTLQNTGNGSPPLPTNIDRSQGCAAGHFRAEKLIDVLGQPDPGWAIDGWHGTLNDSGITEENVVRMPDSDHTVTVYYITSAYLPTVSNNFVIYFEGPQEVEPNNGLSVSKANGPIRSGQQYFGGFPSVADQFDIFYFYLADKGNVQVALTDIPTGRDYNLHLYSAAAQLMGYSGSLGNSDEHISSGNLEPGVYFVAIDFSDGDPSSSQYKVTTIYK